MEPAMRIESNAEIHDPASALRAIGQDLADLFPLILEIQVKGDQFIVTGKGLPDAQAEGETILNKVWKALIHQDPATDLVDWQLKSVPFSRTYSRADLSRSNNERSKERKVAGDLPEIYSLSERLRIIGRIVHAKGGHLTHLTKTLHGVTFQFRDGRGLEHSEKYSAEELYRIQRQYYSRRGTGSESLNN